MIYRLAFCLLIATLHVTAFAQAPYPINGLHTQLTFATAVAQVQQAGGSCKDIRSTQRTGGVAKSCQYARCKDSEQDENCDEKNAGSSLFTIGMQPVTAIEFEATTPDSELKSIGFFFEGEHAAVVKALITAFGQPDIDTESARATSWSDSRRLFWRQGIERASLLDSPKMILLAADRTPEEAP